MIELAFDESAAGALQAAQRSCNTISGDVLPLTLALEVGSLADLQAEPPRQPTLNKLFGEYPGVVDELAQSNRRTLNRLRAAQAAGEPVRLWACLDDPGEVCGLLFLCAALPDAQLALLPLPRTAEAESCVVRYRNTGELPPRAFHDALAGGGQTLSPSVQRACARRWQELLTEDAPLRAMVNGRLTSVPANFYDFVLRRNLPEGAFPAALALGRALGELPGVHDRWLYLRLLDMIKSGELEEVAAPDGGHPYSGVLRRGV